MTRNAVLDRAVTPRPEHSPGAGPSTDAVTPRRRSLVVPTLLQLLAMVAIGALVYPQAADWFAQLRHNSEISGYLQQVQSLPTAQVQAKLQAAREYNAHLPAGVLRDPFSEASTAQQEDAAYAAYKNILAVSDNGVIGQLTYSAVGINLPIYYGTEDSVLRKGVGHLYGSSLPVGGPSTHTVLTSHSGLPSASLFTPLPKARVGDTFRVMVLGETSWYRVDRIETVRPDQTQDLSIVKGEDYVTLVTCTPIGINSHRLLVRGARIDAPQDTSGTHAIAGDGRTAGFPWWAVEFFGGSGAVALILFAPPRRRPSQATPPRGGRES